MTTKNNNCTESFKVKITHRTGDHFVVGDRNGNWSPAPFALDMSISVADPEHVYQDIIDLLMPYRQINDVYQARLDRFDYIIRELSLEGNLYTTITLKNRINKLQHKLESLKYHSDECIRRETEYETKYKNKYINSIVELEEIDPVFEYETEGFLFQTKSALDILGQIIGLVYRLSGVVTYHDYGYDLIEKIIKSSAFRDNENNKNEIIKILERNSKWVKKLVLMRNLITHYSDLLGSRSITHRAATSNEDYAVVCYPSMPDNERVTTFMNNTWSNLTTLITEVGKVILKLQ